MRFAKACPHFYALTLLFVPLTTAAFASFLHKSMQTFSTWQQMSTDRANWDDATLRTFLELVIE
jgi:hypothetical protein